MQDASVSEVNDNTHHHRVRYIAEVSHTVNYTSYNYATHTSKQREDSLKDKMLALDPRFSERLTTCSNAAKRSHLTVQHKGREVGPVSK